MRQPMTYLPEIYTNTLALAGALGIEQTTRRAQQIAVIGNWTLAMNYSSTEVQTLRPAGLPFVHIAPRHMAIYRGNQLWNLLNGSMSPMYEDRMDGVEELATLLREKLDSEQDKARARMAASKQEEQDNAI